MAPSGRRRTSAKTDPSQGARAGSGEPPRRAARPAGGPQLVGSAGARVLGDLGLTDAELFAFLPADAPRWIRGVLWCQFELARSIEEIAAHFQGRYEVTWSVDPRFPPAGPAEGIPVRTLTLRPRGRYVAYLIYGMRGEAYVEDGSFQLEAAFHRSGTAWGSNRAIYERFKAIELTGLGATGVRELTE